MMDEFVNLLEVKLSEETWDAVYNTKAKHLSRGVTPNWLFFSTDFVDRFPELRNIKKMSGMSVHICDLPVGYELMMVHLDKNHSLKGSTKTEEK